jgi:hypothetical protein
MTCVLAVSLASCASPRTVTVTQTVKVAVPVPCVASLPQPVSPFLTRQQILQGSGGQVVRKFDGELAKHEAYEVDLVAALTGCLSVPKPAPQGTPDTWDGVPRG